MVPSSQAHELLEKSGLIELHSSILMDTTISLVGKHVPNQELVMSPVLLVCLVWISHNISESFASMAT